MEGNDLLLQGLKRSGMMGKPPGFENYTPLSPATSSQPPPPRTGGGMGAYSASTPRMTTTTTTEEERRVQQEIDEADLSTLLSLALSSYEREGEQLQFQQQQQYATYPPPRETPLPFSPPPANMPPQFAFNNNNQGIARGPPFPGSPMMMPMGGVPLGLASPAPPPPPPMMMPPPPPSMLPPRGIPGGMFGAGPAPPPPQLDLNHLPNTKYMTGKEIAQLYRMQLKGLETGDEFSDNYYMNQYLERTSIVTANGRQHPSLQDARDNTSFALLTSMSTKERPGEVLKFLKSLRTGGRDASSALSVLHHSRPTLAPLAQEVTSRRLAIQEKRARDLSHHVDKWASSNAVLGRPTRSNIRTPRELLNLGSENDATASNQFTRGVWPLRQRISLVADLVLRIEDLNQLIKAKAAALPSEDTLQAPEWSGIRDDLKRLEDSQMELCQRLAEEMGVRGGGGDEADRKLMALLWLPKGRRVCIRGARCILPEDSVSFLESGARMLVYFCCTSPDGLKKEDKTSEEYEKASADELAASFLREEMTRVRDLSTVSRILSLFLQTQTPESLRAVVATPGGAEVIRGWLIHGHELSESNASQVSKTEWDELFAQFLKMAEEGISAKER